MSANDMKRNIGDCLPDERETVLEEPEHGIEVGLPGEGADE